MKKTISEESFKRMQDHVATLTSRLVQVIANLEEVRRRNEGLAKAEVEDKAKVDVSEKKLGVVNKTLAEAKLKAFQVQTVQLEKAFTEVSGRAKELETEVKRLKAKVSKAKEIGIAEFKELDVYRSDLTNTVALFIAKERMKMRRLLPRFH